MGGPGLHLIDIDGPICTEAVIWKLNFFSFLPLFHIAADPSIPY